MKWSRRLSECFKFLVGAFMCGAVAFLCVEPFLKHVAKFDAHHFGFVDWLLAILIVPGIFLTLVISVICMFMCLTLAVRSIRGNSGKKDQ